MTNTFEVTVRKKIPYLTNFLYYLFALSVIIMWLVYLFFVPSKDSSEEMQVAWYILGVPNFVKYAVFYSAIGLIISHPLWVHFRFYKDATLTFLPDAILLKGKTIVYTLPIDRIKKVFCMDLLDHTGFPKGKLILYFDQKRKRKIKESFVRVRLKDYSEIDDFMEQLSKYQDLEIKVYDTDISPDPNEEI